jgi:tetratricopeptide (TPR) repeat protein
MSDSGFRKQVAAVLSDRWQVPLALVAAAAAAGALYQLMPGPLAPDMVSLLADVTKLQEGGHTTEAADALANLLEMQPPLPAADQIELHERLADLIFEQEQQRAAPLAANVERLIAHVEAAERLGAPRTARRVMQVAQAEEWLGWTERAIRSYRELLASDAAPQERHGAIRSLVHLLSSRPEAAGERDELLEGMLSDEALDDDSAWWAMRQAVAFALDDDDALRASLLLGKYGSRLATSNLKGYGEYLRARVLVHEGRIDEAAPVVHWVDEWLKAARAAAGNQESLRELTGLNRWLLGRVWLGQRQPDRALAAFEEGLAFAGDDPGMTARATAGRAEALAGLERYRDSRAALREAARALDAEPGEHGRAWQRLRSIVKELCEARRSAGDYATAQDYLSLAAELTPADAPAEKLQTLEKLASTALLAAKAAAHAAAQREHLLCAAEAFEAAAALAADKPQRQGGLLWSAAQSFDQAGEVAGVQRTLRQFLEGRPADARWPLAYLELGQAGECEGRVEEALDWYARLREQYPALEESFRGALRSAGCLVEMGREDEAEALLLRMLDNDLVTPQAQAFRSALLQLCELLYRQGRYADAIGRLEDFLALYPADPDCGRARFLRADAYRCSAYQLRQAEAGAAGAQYRATAQERFQVAADLFDQLEKDSAAAPDPDDETELYRRLALLYSADCLFELNDPPSLRRALERYRRAAAAFEQEPLALTAQIQMANIHLRGGRLADAARAVERARWLLRSMPDEAFAGWPGPGRKDWEQYLAAISSARVFQAVFAGQP